MARSETKPENGSYGIENGISEVQRKRLGMSPPDYNHWKNLDPLTRSSVLNLTRQMAANSDHGTWETGGEYPDLDKRIDTVRSEWAGTIRSSAHGGEDWFTDDGKWAARLYTDEAKDRRLIVPGREYAGKVGYVEAKLRNVPVEKSNGHN